MSPIVYAFGALFAWGIGDVLLQRLIRHIGVAETTFVLGSAVGIGLLPFVVVDIHAQLLTDFPLVLLLACVFWLLNGLTIFWAFKVGKMAAVEPVLGLELPLTVLLSIFVLNESITVVQAIAVAIVFLGAALTSAKELHHLHFHKKLLEKGVMMALGAAIFGAFMSVTIGLSSKQLDPLLVVWFLFISSAFFVLPYIWFFGSFKKLHKRVDLFTPLVIGTIIADTSAWIFYAFSTHGMEVALAVSISEGSIALAAFLGIYFNREKLKSHQHAGILLTSGAILWLARIS